MPTTAIIGAGFSGTITALNLLAFDVLDPSRVVMFERAGKFGPGLAYSTRALVHYLNVPAGNMSAWEHDPQHFIRWLQHRNPAASGASFVSRGWYGDYLREQLDAARVRFHDRLELKSASVLGIHPRPDGRLDIHDSNNQITIADRAVLALGNFPSPHPPGATPALIGHPGYINNPWQPDAITCILPHEPVLMVGTGLTMMDIVMQLHAREHAGRMIAISRHGLLPRPHRSPARPLGNKPAPDLLANWNGSTRHLLHLLRQAVRDHAARGIDWRDVVASLRPVTAQLWQRLDAHERARFLSRIRSFWEVIRHRAAPESSAAVADLLAARQLSIRAGRILSIEPVGRLIEVTFRPRRSENRQCVRVSRVINCLGPQTDISAISDPLVQQLRTDGLITADPHGLGLAVSSSGESIRRDGTVDPSLLVIGPLRKGQHWENTAVPELRRQAAELAKLCMASPTIITRNAAAIGYPSATIAHPTSPD